jgi:hypothetical protein
MPPTVSPSNAPSEDPLAGCDPVIPCDDDDGVVFCLLGDNEEVNVEICLPVSHVDLFLVCILIISLPPSRCRSRLILFNQVSSSDPVESVLA